MEKKKNPKIISLEFTEASEKNQQKLKHINVKLENKGLELKIKFIRYKNID